MRRSTKQERVTKIDIARRQIDAAIRLLFEDGDLIAVHTLAFAAKEVLGDLCKARGIRSEVDDEIRRHLPPGEHKQFHHAMRKHALFYKHAREDPDGEIGVFPEFAVEAFIQRGIERFQALGHARTTAMNIFRVWMLGKRRGEFIVPAGNEAEVVAYGNALRAMPKAIRRDFCRGMLLIGFLSRDAAYRERSRRRGVVDL